MDSIFADDAYNSPPLHLTFVIYWCNITNMKALLLYHHKAYEFTTVDTLIEDSKKLVCNHMGVKL